MSALRSFRQLSVPSKNILALRGAQRSLSLARTALCKPASFVPQVQRQFSASARLRDEGTSDLTLSQKLQQELQYEEEAENESGIPDFIKDFKAQGVWQITDNAGSDEVTFTRVFGNESIRLMISIADMNPQPELETEEGAEAEEQSEDAYPLRCSISITKPSTPGALNIDALCQEGGFIIENVSYYADGKLGTELTAESDWKRRGLYLGPTFEQLDPALQEAFEKYLAERGINETLGMFIPEYAEYKEQKEYINWLRGTKSFVEN